MNLYPAIRFRMGDWDYYVVKMTTRELSDSVKFAYEIYEDRTLDEAIQRALNLTRVNREIVTYLKRQPARFFSSVVIAALEGDPRWYPVEIADDERFAVFRDDRRLNSTFGVLVFDGTQDYYALDGQHRLAGIRTVLDRNHPDYDGRPENFDEDEISVIIVVPKVEETDETFMQRYRRLFSNLNRYAKPMDAATNIIMDEDDAFAILTRRLVTEHEFFRWHGPHRESPKIKTEGGKNLRSIDPYFTSIITLYEMNETLLSSASRRDRGWGPGDEGEDVKVFKRFRPDEDYLDRLYEELVMYWDALLAEIPDIRRDPPTMRVHSADEQDEEAGVTDHLLFWPIGQELLADLVRALLDRRLPNADRPDPAGAADALRGLDALEWRLHEPPWRYFLLTGDERGQWRMRSEDRAGAVRVGLRIQRWLVGHDELDEDEIQELKLEWSTRLSPAQLPQEEARLWSQVEEQAI